MVRTTSKQFYQSVGLVQDPNKVKKKTSKRKPSKPTKYVQELEKEANKPKKQKFKFGKVMCKELEYYINKYGEDYESMARDKKNVYQDSPGQLRYKIKKYLKIHKPDQSSTD